MHIVAFLFFFAVLALALGVIRAMLVQSDDRILTALAGPISESQNRLAFVAFAPDQSRRKHAEIGGLGGEVRLALAA
jgi:hypothetical protein